MNSAKRRPVTLLKRQWRSLNAQGFADVGKDASVVFLAKVAAALLALVFNAVIARTLPVEEVGAFYVFQSVVLIGAILLRIGLDNVVLREAAVDEAGKRITGLLQGSVLMIVLLAFVAAAVLQWLVMHDFPVLGVTGVMDTWVLASAAALLAICVLYSEAYRGRRRMLLSQWMGANGLGLYAGLLLVVAVMDVPLPVAYAACLLGVFLTGFWTWPVRTLHAISPTSRFYQSRWLFLAQLAEMSSIWLPVLALGASQAMGDAGVFGPIYRVVLIASGMMVAFNLAGAPRFAVMYQQGDIRGLMNLARKKTFVTACLSAPVFLLFLAFPEWCLRLYGEQYAGFGGVLVILALSQLVNVLSGPVGYLLVMSQHERAFAVTHIAGLLVNAAVLWWALPVWGILGAASALAVAIAVQNFLGVLFVRHLLGFFTLGIWHEHKY